MYGNNRFHLIVNDGKQGLISLFFPQQIRWIAGKTKTVLGLYTLPASYSYARFALIDDSSADPIALIDAAADPSLAPFFVGLSWASSFMERLLK
jgi:hypothetical protein